MKGLGNWPGGRRKPPPPCGTDAGYQHHRRWFETPCVACLAAHTKMTSYRPSVPWTERQANPLGEGGPDPHQGIIAELIYAGAIALVITPDGRPFVWVRDKKEQHHAV